MRNKILKYALLSSPIILSTGSVGIYYVIKNKSKNKIEHYVKKINIITQDPGVDQYVEIFPEMSAYDFYENIKVTDDKPAISDELIGKFITEVIKKTKYTNGFIHWKVNKESIDNVKITFVWKPSTSSQANVWKNYKLLLST